jgi:hypothetical protein
METPLPGTRDIDQLLAYLPQFYEPNFEPIIRWVTRDQDGKLVMPWPVYAPVVEQFFRAAAGECWCDYQYDSQLASLQLEQPGYIESANLKQIKMLMTFCVRGERFCDGHWASMIQQGHIKRLCKRLEQLRSRSSA